MSSSEAEYYACAEAVKEVPFIVELLTFVRVPVKIPVEVRVDNVGAIFMTENTTSSNRSRHMDTRWHYVNEMQVNDLIKLMFVKSEENVADIATKNVTGDTLERHIDRVIATKDYWDIK